MRLMQHKKEAWWFYRFLSNFYDELVNPLFWTVPMREKALRIAGLDQPQEGQPLKVIDVGSGTGFTTEGIVEYLPAAQVTCVDQSPHQMRFARKRDSLRGARFELGDAENLPFDEGSFDRYVSAGSIEYWPNPEQGVREAFRVIKPGGRATLIGPIEPPVAWGRFLANTWMLFPKEEAYLDWFERAGFEDIQIEYLDPSWYHGRGHFALAIAGNKPLDAVSSPFEAYQSMSYAAQEPEREASFLNGAKTAARVVVGAAAGGAFIPIALGAKAISALRGTDDPREPLTGAQKTVLAALGTVAAVSVGVWLLRDRNQRSS